MMNHFKWLKKEVPRWIEEELITRGEGDSILSFYKNEERHSHGEGLFVLAAVCLLVGLIFVCAGFWSSLSQDERFMMAMVPLLLSLLLLAGILWKDRLIEDPPVIDKSYYPLEAAGDSLDYGTMSDLLTGGKDRRAPAEEIGVRAGEAAKESLRSRLIPSGTYHHSIPDVLREAAGVFHGVAVLGAVWMVNDSFKLSNDWFILAVIVSVFLLVMGFICSSAGLGMIYMASAVLVYRLSPYQGWPEAVSWIFLVLALPLLVRLLGERRHKAVVCYSWFWAVCVLALIFWTASNILWQTMFFSLAAALTWMAGSMLASWGSAAEALKLFGGAAVFGVLLEGSWGPVWANISGSWTLWTLFFVILAIDAVLISRMELKREWLAILAGLTPFAMLIAASVAVFETTGAASAIVISTFAAFLALAVIGSGYQRGSDLLKWTGALLLIAAGAMRVVDSALTFGQRGMFFLVVAVIAFVVCGLTFIPRRGRRPRRKAIRKKEGQTPIPGNTDIAAPSNGQEKASEATGQKNDEGGEKYE